jgi:ATP-binding cassette, subfamily B, bacterial
MLACSRIRFHAIAERRKSPPITRRILEQARSCRLQLGGIVLLSLLAAPLALLLPLPLKIVVDNIAAGKPAPAWLRGLAPIAYKDSALLLACALLLAIGALMQLHALASWILQTYTGEKLVLEFR